MASESSDAVEGGNYELIRAESEPDVVKRVADPRLPSENEVQRHLLRGHIPFRDWCPICVKAMGKSLPHRRSERERNVPEYSFDYCFPGDELGYRWTVLVGKERLSGNFFATTVPAKGGKGRFDVNRIMEFIACLLYTSPSPRDRQKSRMPSSA